MKKLLVLLLVLFPCLCFAQAQFTFGPQFVTEKNLNIETKTQYIAWQTSGMLLSPDVFADYRITFYQDTILWHRVEIGINRNRNLKPFFSCDYWNNSAHVGGGLRLIYPVNRMYVDLTAGGYDKGYIASGKLGMAGPDTFVDVGFETNKKEDTMYYIPTIRFGFKF